MVPVQAPQSRREYRTVPGISDSRRLPRIGRLRLGVKKKSANGKTHPAETDYFVIDVPDSNSSSAERAIHKRFTEAYGEKPKVLDVIVASEDREVFFPQAYKAYGAAGLKCIGDGRTARRLGTDGQFHDVAEGCPGPELCPFSKSIGVSGKPGCKFVGSLFVLLPKVSLAGYFQIDTSSKTSAIAINSSIETIQQMFGRVAGLAYIDPDTGEAQTALRIVRRPTKIQYEGKTTVHYPVVLEARITLEELLKLKSAGALGFSSASLSAKVQEDDRPTEDLPMPDSSIDDLFDTPEEDVTDIIDAFDRLDVPPEKRTALLAQNHDRLRERLREKGALQ